MFDLTPAAPAATTLPLFLPQAPPDKRSYGASGEGMAPSSLQSNR
jgi:hypothetical protein